MDRKKKVITLELTEFDLKILLEALGTVQHMRQDSGQSGRPQAILIERVYRKMGVRLGKA